MCMFTQPVLDVSKTKIFARKEGDYQYLAYQMDFNSVNDMAMILPIPTTPNPSEDAISFIDFKRHGGFFNHLHELFVESERSMTLGFSKGSQPRSLKVHDVGDFKATFVPTLADFDRVDKQFKFNDTIWNNLPQYTDWSFVVFKLKPGIVTVHPMVFKFPTRFTDKVYFPTMHVHDGEIHEKEKFDHKLYYQPEWIKTSAPYIKGWKNAITRYNEYEGVLKAGFPILRRELSGNLPNEDQWLSDEK